MSVVSLLGVKVLNNPAPFTSPYEFEITFECLEQLREGQCCQLALPLLHQYSLCRLSRSRVEAHIRWLCDLGRARPGTRLAPRRPNSNWRQQVHLRSRPTQPFSPPLFRDPRRHRHPTHLFLRWPRIRSRRLLRQQ